MGCWGTSTVFLSASEGKREGDCKESASNSDDGNPLPTQLLFSARGVIQVVDGLHYITLKLGRGEQHMSRKTNEEDIKGGKLFRFHAPIIPHTGRIANLIYRK